MKEQLTESLRLAIEEQAVARQTLDGAMSMLAYPLETGALLGLGYESAEAVMGQAEAVLARRGEDPARFGAWLPAMLRDGSLYLVRRLTADEIDGGGPSDDALHAARELLA